MNLFVNECNRIGDENTRTFDDEMIYHETEI